MTWIHDKDTPLLANAEEVALKFSVGDRVKVTQLIKDEPCSDIDVLIGKVGTVIDPAVDDEDYDGNAIVVIRVDLDKRVNMGGYPSQYSKDFVFRAEELAHV